MSNYSPTPQRHRSPWSMISFALFVVLIVAACVIALLIHNQRSASSAPASTTARQQPAVSAAATAPTCASVFKLGASITSADAIVACTNRLGLVSRSHSMTCRDGRVMIFDTDSDVYGFAGGKFAPSDVDADSQYAKDFYACVG
jgi:hypothetical protein